MQMRKGISLVVASLLIAGFAVFALSAGRLLILDAPQHSDVILVLAGETDHRPSRAVELLEQGSAKRVMIDVPAAANVFGFTEVQLAQQYAHNLPENSAVSICPIVGLSTRDEAHDAAGCLTGQPADRILIVTSDFHTRRALSVFRHEIPGKEFSVAAARDDAQFGVRWWTHRQWAKTTLDEWLKVIWWNAVDRWR